MLICFFDGHPAPRKAPDKPGLVSYIIRDSNGVKIDSDARPAYVGANTPLAEYAALTACLRALLPLFYVGEVRIYGDAKLIVNQVNDKWQSKSAEMLKQRDLCRRLIDALQQNGATVRVAWLPRSENQAHPNGNKKSKVARKEKHNEYQTQST